MSCELPKKQRQKHAHNFQDKELRCTGWIPHGVAVSYCRAVNRKAVMDRLKYIIEFNKGNHPIGTIPIVPGMELLEAIYDLLSPKAQ